MTFFTVFTRLWVLKLIKLYQRTFSFDHGFLRIFFPHGFCRFKPTCSEYACQAIEKYGLGRGGLKAFWRVLRCNPLSKGGYEPLD